MEYVDLYRNEFEQLHRRQERNMPLQPGEYSVIVFACIFNREGKLLIQQRSPEKRGWSGLWDVSACGAMQSGEDSLSAVRREVKEELGLDFEREDFTRLMSIYYENRIHDIYTLVCPDVDPEDLRLQEGEVSKVKWACREEIEAMIDSGDFIRIYKEFIGLIFQMKNRKGILMQPV